MRTAGRPLPLRWRSKNSIVRFHASSAAGALCSAIGSFKTYEQIQFATSIYVPSPFTWENYSGLWTETRFPTWLRNSLITALVVTAITTVVAGLGGYAVARLRFRDGSRWRA